ncbi:MAG: alpha/beta-type small acid-soluble spore protein [Romboutsia sp.]
MSNKQVNQNAKKALNQMKLEIANELGIETNNINGATNTSQENGKMGGNLGGIMSRKLVEMGEKELIKRYNSQN